MYARVEYKKFMYIECYVSARISSVRCVRPIFLLKKNFKDIVRRTFISVDSCRKYAFIQYVMSLSPFILII